MKFANQENLSNYVKNIGIKGSPSAAVYNNKLYIIYDGAGNDGLYFITYDGKDWVGPTHLADVVSNVGLAEGASPAAVVAHGLLYIFYNGAGNDGTYYITYDGEKVSAPESIKSKIIDMKFKEKSSPAAAAYRNMYVFWCVDDENSIYYSVFDRNTWTGQTRIKSYIGNLGVAGGSSPWAVEYMADLYLFYNGFGNDGTFYTVLTGKGWQPQVGIKGQIGEMGFRSNTSPTACLSGGSYALLVFWAGSGQNGIYVTSYDGVGTKTWTKQERVKCPNGDPGILDGTSPCAILYNQTPYLFWRGSGDDGIYMTKLEA